MSPEKWLPVVPVRARPSGTRRANALHCPGSNGASVATMTMTEPAPGGDRSPRSRREPTAVEGVVVGEGRTDVATRDGQFAARAEVRLHERGHGEGVRAVLHPRDEVPLPPLNS